VRKTNDYDRLSVECVSERIRAARDARYRTNVEFVIRQARCVTALVLAVIAAVTGGPRLVVAVVDALEPSDRPARITPPAADPEPHHEHSTAETSVSMLSVASE
jgi:hypothetical protein